jgi:hypothetical protein
MEIASAMAALFGDLADGICASDGEGRILYLNPAAERLLDVRLEAAGGQNVCDLICGRLAVPGASECASNCPLRNPQDPARTVTYTGHYNQKPAYRWLDLGVQRLKKGKSMRIRCLRMPLADRSSPNAERHFTLLEDVSK